MLGCLAGPHHRLEKGCGVVDRAPESTSKRWARVLPSQASKAFWAVSLFASPRGKLVRRTGKDTGGGHTLWKVKRRVRFPESFSFAGRFWTG